MSQLADLQAAIANLERGRSARDFHALGIKKLDSALQGGLERGALHEVSGAGAFLWLSQFKLPAYSNWVWLNVGNSYDVHSAMPFGSGIAYSYQDKHGLCPDKLLWVQLNDRQKLCQVANEILSDTNTSLLIIAMVQPLNLTAARKLHLAARQSNGLCFIIDMRFRANDTPICANAMTRWIIALNSKLMLTVKLIKNRTGLPVECELPIAQLHHDFSVISPDLVGNRCERHG